MSINHVIKLVQKYQKTKSDFLFEEIIYEFESCINYQLTLVNQYFHEDLRQELLNVIYLMILKFKINLELEGELESNEKLLNFKKKYFEKSKKPLKVIAREYQLFKNEKQFRKYVLRACSNVRRNFQRKEIKKYEMQESLNKVVSDDTELLELIEVKKDEFINVLDELNQEDRDYLKDFIKSGIWLTMKDVAKEKGVSPQAVSAKINKIRKKLRKILSEKKDE